MCKYFRSGMASSRRGNRNCNGILGQDSGGLTGGFDSVNRRQYKPNPCKREEVLTEATRSLGVVCRRVCFVTIGPVIDLAFGDGVATLTVAVKIEIRADRSVDWQLLPIDTKTGKLGVKVGEVAPSEKWIRREVDARHNVRCAVSDLLCLRKLFLYQRRRGPRF